MTETRNSICILPRIERIGGPASFQARLAAGLLQRGVRVHFDPRDTSTAAILVIGGTRHMDVLWQARRRGVRIVQRLNGLNWIHRKTNTGWRHYLRAEWSNWILATIRRYLADSIVYQSEFARNWWQTVYHTAPASQTVIHNGVDLQIFSPDGPQNRPTNCQRLLVVEGRLSGGYERGLENAIHLTEELNQTFSRNVELMVVGEVPPSLQEFWQARDGQYIRWAGVQRSPQIPEIDRSAHVLFSSDLNAACPNTVVESLACGLPVVSFATGSLPELVKGDSGRVVPYGSNYWNLEKPDIHGLAAAACEILDNQERFRQAARKHAEETLGLEIMVERYLKVLIG